MNAKWEAIANYHADISQKLADPNLDPKERQKLQKEFAHLEVLIEKYKQIAQLDQELSDAKKQVQESGDTELQKLFQEEIPKLEQTIDQEKQALDNLLAPPGELDDRSVFLEFVLVPVGKRRHYLLQILCACTPTMVLKKGGR